MINAGLIRHLEIYPDQRSLLVADDNTRINRRAA